MINVLINLTLDNINVEVIQKMKNESGKEAL